MTISNEDRQRWDAVYRKHLHKPLPPPDPLLLNYTPPGGDRAALDVAAGFGQNALWLAAQGYIVDVMDISRVALGRARVEAGQREIRGLNFFQVDLDSTFLAPDSYQLVCVFRFLKRRLFTQLRACVAPGGRIIYQTFNMNYLRIRYDFNPAHLLEPGELVGYFSDWDIVLNREVEHVSQLVAIKPESPPAPAK